ncbi:MAG: hypothetical protein R3F31_08630 [Verrucomicrobiales bacterium]
MLLIWFVYPLGPAARGSVPSQQPKPQATAAKPMSAADPLPRAERRVSPKEVVCLTYARPKQRWEAMNEEALRESLRDNVAGVVTLQYAEGEHALLKVVWPEVLEVGDRFTVELRERTLLKWLIWKAPTPTHEFPCRRATGSSCWRSPGSRKDYLHLRRPVADRVPRQRKPSGRKPEPDC